MKYIVCILYKNGTHYSPKEPVNEATLLLTLRTKAKSPEDVKSIVLWPVEEV